MFELVQIVASPVANFISIAPINVIFAYLSAILIISHIKMIKLINQT
jgi:hypothetical protein